MKATIAIVFMLMGLTAAGQAQEGAGNAEGFGVYLRPLDDSDVEMRALMRKFFETTPCGPQVNGMCDEALALLTGGGERLAGYLIRQWEANEVEGFPNKGTYLRLLGHTESEVAYRYLTALVEKREAEVAAGVPDAHHELQDALEGLGRTRHRGVAAHALRILETSPYVGVRVAAVNALDRVQAKHGVMPGAAERLRAVRTRLPVNPSAGFNAKADIERIDAVLAAPGRTRP